MQSLGRLCLFLGLVLILAGALLLLLGRLGIPLGHLPGDISIRGKRFFVFAPLTTMVLISVVLTLVLNLLFRWFR